MNRIIWLFIPLLLIAKGSNNKHISNKSPYLETKNTSVLIKNNENPFIQLKGTNLVDAQGNAIYLQGIGFSNFVWSNSAYPPKHHTELDYARVRAMGMNVIRFYMNYRFFENDIEPFTYKKSGWDWLDQNLKWAKKHNIYLILTMVVPQGGYQSQGKGNALWDDKKNQVRLAALWEEIARRYVNEGRIAGFGLVNEPVPNRSMQQWTDLAQQIIDKIRIVDKRHLIFIERAPQVSGNNTPDKNLNFPMVTGDNLVYEFHAYEPYHYTHQLLNFTELVDGGKYPDDTIIETYGAEWYTATYNNPSLPKDDSDWAYFEGERYKINDSKIALARPTLVANATDGRVYFDDITIREFDEQNHFVRNVYRSDLGSPNGWYFYSKNESGSWSANSTGHNDLSSLYIEGTTDNSSLTNFPASFTPRQNYSYQINGWMKGENIASDQKCKLRLDFYKSNNPISKRNKAYLKSVIEPIIDWAKSKNIALYMGEFGAGYSCFQNGKGGIRFVADMIEIAEENTIHFTYHAYHEDAFGLYLGNGIPNPNHVNQPLIDWFSNHLK